MIKIWKMTRNRALKAPTYKTREEEWELVLESEKERSGQGSEEPEGDVMEAQERRSFQKAAVVSGGKCQETEMLPTWLQHLLSKQIHTAL